MEVRCSASWRSISAFLLSNINQMRSNLVIKFFGKLMLSTTDFFGSYDESFGFADARMDVRAFKEQTMPAFATLTVCCSIASWRIARAFSSILSNSSMQHIPLSANTRAPLSSTRSLVTGSLLIEAVRPTALLPLPEVYIARGASLYAYCSNCDFAVDGSPQSNEFISGRHLALVN